MNEFLKQTFSSIYSKNRKKVRKIIRKLFGILPVDVDLDEAKAERLGVSD